MIKRSSYVIAWSGFALGIGVSVAGNIADAALGQTEPAELIGAAFWPLALMFSIEILTRTPWPTGRRWGAARFLGIGTVALVAFVLSYRHMAALMSHWGEDWLNAHLGPLAVDGLMLISATALLAITKVRADARASESASARAATPAPPVDTPKPVEPPKQKKLHVVDSIPETADEEHARQLWLASGGTMSGQKVADMLGKSRSSGYRLVQTWKEEATG